MNLWESDTNIILSLLVFFPASQAIFNFFSNLSININSLLHWRKYMSSSDKEKKTYICNVWQDKHWCIFLIISEIIHWYIFLIITERNLTLNILDKHKIAIGSIREYLTIKNRILILFSIQSFVILNNF